MMKRFPMMNSVFLPILLSIALAAGGCVSSASKNLVGSYGKSTANISATAASTFQTVRANENQFRVAQALANPSLSVSKGLAPPTIKWKSIALRVSLLSELGKYGKALEAMASDGELDRIDEASRNLGEALGGLNSRVQEVKGDEKPPLTNEQLGTVATVTNVAGRWFFERKRYQAMLETVEIADPLIQQSVDLLLKELQETSCSFLSSSFFARSIWNFSISSSKVLSSSFRSKARVSTLSSLAFLKPKSKSIGKSKFSSTNFEEISSVI